MPDEPHGPSILEAPRIPSTGTRGEPLLKDALARQGTEIRPGDTVVVRTGCRSGRPDPAEPVRTARRGIDLAAGPTLRPIAMVGR